MIYLASASPRRSALLQQIDVPHEVRPVDIDETPRPDEAFVIQTIRLVTDDVDGLLRDLLTGIPGISLVHLERGLARPDQNSVGALSRGARDEAQLWLGVADGRTFGVTQELT